MNSSTPKFHTAASKLIVKINYSIRTSPCLGTIKLESLGKIYGALQGWHGITLAKCMVSLHGDWMALERLLARSRMNVYLSVGEYNGPTGYFEHLHFARWFEGMSIS